MIACFEKQLDIAKVGWRRKQKAKEKEFEEHKRKRRGDQEHSNKFVRYCLFPEENGIPLMIACFEKQLDFAKVKRGENTNKETQEITEE